MQKKVIFFIDDVIWLFRDLTRQRPAALFDNPFLKMLKGLHDDYGTKVQLNIFCETDRFYGNDHFSLTEMTDAYKAEFEAASDWLKFGFHARQEFPDYPYINATYEHVTEDLTMMKHEVFRFAGENSFSISTTPHWRPISREGCRALYDGGIRIMSATYGEKIPFEGNAEKLPYGHAGRLLQNRQPETQLFTRDFSGATLAVSICAYNHISTADRDRTQFTCETVYDSEVNMHYKDLLNAPVLDKYPLEEIAAAFQTILDKEFVCYATHEQYFHADYFAYQPDYPEKLRTAARLMAENGFEFIFGGDLL